MANDADTKCGYASSISGYSGIHASVVVMMYRRGGMIVDN